MKKLLALFFIITQFFGCNPDSSVVDPKFTDQSILIGTNILSESQKNKMEGIYIVTIGKDKFGGNVVLKWNKNSLSIFGVKLGTNFVLNAGTKNNEIFLEGKWRYAQSLDIGLVRFTISEENGANSILNDSINSVIRMIGNYSENDENLDKEITLEFSRKFSSKTTEKPFYILAHRGGGRNSDNLGASENTIEMINLAENLGANGIEIDVKLSKDNIPFLYHDVSLNLRTTTDSPIWGPVEDFTFSQLRSLIKLKNGEQIPSLEEALEFVLTETKLNVVWLDMKSEKNSMPFVVPIQQEFMERAKVLGRDVKIFIGLPDETMLQNFLQTPNFENIESLCELSIENMNKTKSIIWAPRWSLGLQNESVQNLHSQNKLAFTWTLDQAQFIYEFIDNGSFDGILTNYPTLVAYYYYVQE
ncbi:MAG: glycerophosphodiester phosphodiesterase [Ignavibacteriales bacterium]|nr:glycerophosphodiester phosphodiesterase [Ignavibacteriales bacterium]